MGRFSVPHLAEGKALRDFLNLAATQTSRADGHSLDVAADRRADLFQIRMPSTLGLVVCMADVVADRLMLFANRAVLHDAYFFRFGKSS
jgi:hypothetical protein